MLKLNPQQLNSSLKTNTVLVVFLLQLWTTKHLHLERSLATGNQCYKPWIQVLRPDSEAQSADTAVLWVRRDVAATNRRSDYIRCNDMYYTPLRHAAVRHNRTHYTYITTSFNSQFLLDERAKSAVAQTRKLNRLSKKLHQYKRLYAAAYVCDQFRPHVGHVLSAPAVVSYPLSLTGV